MVAVVPAVVVGGQVNGLGVVRSVAIGRVPTVVIDTTLRHPAMWSRFSQGVVVKQLSGHCFIDELLALQKKLGGRPVLILTDEMAVNTVSAFREQLAPRYRFHLPSAAMVATLENKGQFHEFAALHALPVPPTVVVKRPADVAKLSILRYPVVVKPTDKRPVHMGLSRRLDYVDTIEEAAAVCGRMLHMAGEIIVQEWIPGPGCSDF